MTEEIKEPATALEAASAQRIGLQSSMSRVEAAAAAPARDPNWRNRLANSLEDLRLALDHHVVVVEASDGLLAELAAAAPRLANQISRVQDEHPVLANQVADSMVLVSEGTDVDTVRSAVLNLLVAISRHRQKGADLVFDAYDVDIGGH
jgi:hypothetical protein